MPMPLIPRFRKPERARDQREWHHQQTEQRDRRHGLNDVEHGEDGHLRFRTAKERMPSGMPMSSVGSSAAATISTCRKSAT
jgi:hypothetical protein